MTTYTLTRSGMPPLKFEGELIGIAGERPDVAPSKMMRWYTLQLYKLSPSFDLDGPMHLLYIQYHTEAHREKDIQSVVIGTLDALKYELLRYDWMDAVQDFPPEPKWDGRRDDREFKIRAVVGETVSELWEDAGVSDRLEDCEFFTDRDD